MINLFPRHFIGLSPTSLTASLIILVNDDHICRCLSIHGSLFNQVQGGAPGGQPRLVPPDQVPPDQGHWPLRVPGNYYYEVCSLLDNFLTYKLI